ncbi:MAG: hypothetical protein EBU81_01275 [Proteobacteria bacterium]|nr:hypothetical protein [Pseudomonadota bacterium]
MEFIKKQYEKLVLGFVLLAVAGLAISLVFSVSQVRSDLENALQQLAGAKQKPLVPENLETNLTQTYLKKVTQRPQIVLAGQDHYTFNPITWTRASSGRLEPSKPRPNTGASGLSYVAAHDLVLEIAFEQVAGTPEAPRYQFSVRRDYEKTANARRAIVESVAVGSENKDQLFRVVEAQGPKESPTNFICELIATRETFQLAKGKSFRRTQGYSADLRYEADRRDFPQKRVGESITLSGAVYKIVAIEKDELVVSAPNSVRTTVAR